MTGILLTNPLIQAAANGGRPSPAAIARCGTRAVEPCGIGIGIGIDGDLWAGSNPHAMAKAALDLFGPAAIEAVAWCALSAHRGRRETDLRFWLAVFDLLDAPSSEQEQEQ